MKFLGHGGTGAGGPERSYTLEKMATRTVQDVLGTGFGLERDWGPLLITASQATIVAQGQTWTPGSGGTFGQSVPAISEAEAVGTAPRALAGLRQGDTFRTNLVIANMKDVATSAQVNVYSSAGLMIGTKLVSVPGFGFVQLNLKNDLAVNGVAGASATVAATDAGAKLGVYASVIDNATGDPRTILAR